MSMRITNQHVEAMLQHLYELGERTKLVRLPVPGIIMPGKPVEERFRVSLEPALSGPEATTAYYEGTQHQCTCYIAELTMRLALEHVFGGVESPSSEPRDSLPQTGEEPSA